MRALIVDDDFIGRKLMLKYLRDYCECDVAVNGDEAKTAFQLAWIEKEPYDVLYLDIVLPESNGYEVLNFIRNYEVINKSSFKLKIVMVSALDDQNHLMNAFKNECNSYLIKPINMEKVSRASEEAGIKLRKRLLY